jgi:hypothetical protein
MRLLYLLLLLPVVGLADPDPDCRGNPHHCTGDPAADIVNIDISSPVEVNDGNTTLSTDASSRYFAFGTSFPNAEGCLGGVQAGFGLVGYHRINISCWSQKLADSEKSLETRARLKCGDKVFRNSIAYDISWMKKKERRKYCIDYIKADWVKQIEAEKAALQQCQKASCTYVNGVLRLEYYDE